MALPSNARVKLKPGEKYIPVVPDSNGWKQFSFYSLIFGFLMLVIFSAASVVLGVKIAQVPEAGMSVCLFAMVYTLIRWRKNALLENVMVQCIASSSTGVACIIFVYPAIYILGLPEVGFWTILTGVCVGVVFAILFTTLVRKYYVADTHGEYSYPEATAAAGMLMEAHITEDKKDGTKSGSSGKLIAWGLTVGGIADLLNNYFGVWKSTFSTTFMPLLDTVAKKAKLVFEYDTSAAVFGMGYIVGWRCCLIIFLTSAVGFWVLIPFFANFAGDPWLAQFIPSTILLDAEGKMKDFAAMDAGTIFKTFIRPIGVGTFFTAGLLSIIFEGKTIIKSVSTLLGKVGIASSGEKKECERDLNGILIVGLFIVTVFAIFGFVYHVLGGNLLASSLLTAAIVVLLVVFLPAAIMATITTGNAPVSGMTIVCLVLMCLILSALGFSGGEEGKVMAIILGTFMCVTLAFGSSFITDLKIGYWLGATPAKQEGIKITATIISAVVAILSLYIVNKQFGFVASVEHKSPMPAPQANAMADIVKTFMGGGAAAWFLYSFGSLIALVMKLKFKISPILIALGLYIPIELNAPLLAGAWVDHLISKKYENESDDTRGKERHTRGEMAATGLIAAGSIAFIVSAVLKYAGFDLESDYGVKLLANSDWSNWISLGVLIAIIVFFHKISNKNEEN